MTKLFFLRGIFFGLSGVDIHYEQLTGTCLTIMLIAALVCFVAAEITTNYSQVDKLWSLMPIVYSMITLAAYPSPRILIMCFLVTIWGLRLTYNLYRKGGYNKIPWKGEEDYRWKIMRRHPALQGRIRFGLFNLIFISFYQHLLIFLFSTPLLIAARYRNSSLTLADMIAASLMLLFIFIETVADYQQFRFQTLKRQKHKSEGLYSGSLKKGFLSEGLWRFARHPNYASEQAIWISFYLFGAAASGKWINWTIIGSVLLILLFLGSTRLTELISGDKYPDYARYIKDVPKFIPRVFSPNKK
jgi:steroid 5-alpha reductase family enzyme